MATRATPTIRRHLGRAKRRAHRLLRELSGASRLERQLDEVRFAVGALQADLRGHFDPPGAVSDAEFKVFSQWGEDGIIQHLVRAVPITDTTFVEIGVGDYRESNTRFLAMHDNWRGSIIDLGTAHKDFLATSGMGWRWSIEAISAQVTAENVNELISSTGVTGDIGLLSIDIDGVDYWIWNAISVVDPRIVVIEFNSLFGPDLPVTVPYDSHISAHAAHHSGQYIGASLAALHQLGTAKGYQLVGVGMNGVNAFFVRRDVGAELEALSPDKAYVASRFRTTRDQSGTLTYRGDFDVLLRSMGTLPLVDLRDGAIKQVTELFPESPRSTLHHG